MIKSEGSTIAIEYIKEKRDTFCDTHKQAERQRDKKQTKKKAKREERETRGRKLFSSRAEEKTKKTHARTL